MRTTLYLCALASLAAAPIAQAQDTAVFKPAGGWTADFGDDYCRLIRNFSDGKNEVSLALERTHPGEVVRLIIVGEGIKPYRSAEEIEYSLLPAGAPAKARFYRSQTADGTQYLTFDPAPLAPALGPPPGPTVYDREKEKETAQGISGFSLAAGLASPARFETGALKAPVEVMQACADDLLEVWGLDPQKHKTMTAAPVPTPPSNGVLPQGTIPFTEFGKLSGGSNQLRLIIGADGKPTSCTVYLPTLSETLNDRICKLAMDRASFQPARDAEGQPMPSFWMGSPMFLGPPFGGR
jgi:hypothetical protein